MIPIFAGLSALGALAGGAAGIARSVSAAGEATKKIDEQIRHNRTLETIALQKGGRGLFLQPYKKGYGIVVRPRLKNYLAGR